MKKILLALAISAVVVACTKKEEVAAPAAAPAAPPVAAAPAELKVAIDATYEPFTFKTADGKPTGFDVDIASGFVPKLSATAYS